MAVRQGLWFKSHLIFSCGLCAPLSFVVQALNWSLFLFGFWKKGLFTSRHNQMQSWHDCIKLKTVELSVCTKCGSRFALRIWQLLHILMASHTENETDWSILSLNNKIFCWCESLPICATFSPNHINANFFVLSIPLKANRRSLN